MSKSNEKIASGRDTEKCEGGEGEEITERLKISREYVKMKKLNKETELIKKKGGTVLKRNNQREKERGREE